MSYVPEDHEQDQGDLLDSPLSEEEIRAGIRGVREETRDSARETVLPDYFADDPAGRQPNIIAREQYEDWAQNLREGQLGPPPGHPFQGPSWSAMPGLTGHHEYSQRDSLLPREESWSKSRITELQNALVGVGLLDQHRVGVWDSASIDAFTELLSYANASNISWDQALEELAYADIYADPESRQLDTTRAPFRESPYLRPDIENVRENVRQSIANSIGLNYIDDEIVERFTNEYMQLHRDRHEQMSALERRQHEIQQTDRIMQRAESQDINIAREDIADDDIPDEPFSEDEEFDDIRPDESLQATISETIRPVQRAQEEEQLADRAQTSMMNVLGILGQAR